MLSCVSSCSIAAAALSLGQCAAAQCVQTIAQVSAFEMVGASPSFVLNSSAFNQTFVNVSGLVVSANCALSLFGEQTLIQNVFVSGQINSSQNFTGYMLSYHPSQLQLSCVQMNISLNISATSTVVLLQN